MSKIADLLAAEERRKNPGPCPIPNCQEALREGQVLCGAHFSRLPHEHRLRLLFPADRDEAVQDAIEYFKPKDGTCCACHYVGATETPCESREDKVHCVHWWEGPDEEA